MFILLAVGALIGTWAMSGTLVAMVYYGLKLLNPNYFYVTTVLICAVVSASIGSSWTVVGTIGVGFMGIAVNMGLNLCIVVPAVKLKFGAPYLLLATTTLGLGLGIYEAFRLAPRIAWLLVLALSLFGAGIAWIVIKASAEHETD